MGITPAKPLRVAAVVDEFTRASLAPEVHLRNLDARLWRLQLPLFRPDLLFVESAWRGSRDTWRRKVATYEGVQDDTLAELVAWCQKRGIPTAFWNKEDPVHFERFLPAARLFDFVFTTDEGVVADYVRACDLPPDHVRPLRFAVQPAIYHPRGAARLPGRIVFAGSYGEPQFPERRRHLEMLLDAAADHDLRIFDRNAGVAGSEKAFPARYAPQIRGALGYRALAGEYRRCEVALNINSVAHSRTMFSRRVFEMLACGACVVSTPSTGIAELFGDVVPLVSTSDEARAAISRFLHDDEHRRVTSERGVRAVFRGHTYADRVAELRALVGV